VLQSPTRARHKSPSDLRWIRVMEIQASDRQIRSNQICLNHQPVTGEAA
jgi:hypothetical protein